MRGYEKPMIIPSGEQEGVFMASGMVGSAGPDASEPDCWEGYAQSVQDWNGSHHVFEMRITHSPSVEHISTAVTLGLHFNYPVVDIYSENDWACTMNGMDGTVKRTSHANAYRSGDNVTFKVWARAADEPTTKSLACSITWFECEKSVNVQGGGADGS